MSEHELLSNEKIDTLRSRLCVETCPTRKTCGRMFSCNCNDLLDKLCAQAKIANAAPGPKADDARVREILDLADDYAESVARHRTGEQPSTWASVKREKLRAALLDGAKAAE